jgi:hypothetical protein
MQCQGQPACRGNPSDTTGAHDHTPQEGRRVNVRADLRSGDVLAALTIAAENATGPHAAGLREATAIVLRLASQHP